MVKVTLVLEPEITWYAWSINTSIGFVMWVGVAIGGAILSNKLEGVGEHVIGIGDGVCDEVIGNADGLEGGGVGEHLFHILNIGGIEARNIKVD